MGIDLRPCDLAGALEEMVDTGVELVGRGGCCVRAFGHRKSVLPRSRLAGRQAAGGVMPIAASPNSLETHARRERHDAVRVGRMSDESPSFSAQIKPLFREEDRRSMQSLFDLWSYDDVSTHADAIMGQLQAGTMPCDGAWPAEQVALFGRWVEADKPE
jgi:hypothetical protein